MRISCALALILIPCAIAADAHWTRIATPHFEMYTTASERNARETLRYFEQVRSFFEQTMPHPLEKPTVVRIVAFNSPKEYEPYRLNEFATAYYHATADHDYIVMSHTGSETFPIATHEYVHLVVKHSNLKFPPWLNEGVAELYSTLKPFGDKILVGSLIEGRHVALLQEKWVPLATIMGAGHDSPYYNEKNKAGSLYNEGWALTHMLALSPEYRPKFSEVLQAISSGTPSVEALEKAYGKPLAKIEVDLQGYLRGGRFQGAMIPAKLEKVADDLKAQPAEDFDVALLLAQISERPGKEDASRAAFEALISKNPQRPEAYYDLGYLEWRQHESDKAREHFAEAFDLGMRSPRLLWDLGRMEESHDAPKAIQAFSELLKQDSTRLDVRLELASVQLHTHAAKAALETLAPVKKVTPEDAPKLLTTLAYANLEAGNREPARNAALQLMQVAKTPEERDRATQLIKYLDGPQRTAMTPSPAPRPEVKREPGDERPVLQRREALQSEFVEEYKNPQPKYESFSGKFIELQCAAKPRIILETAQGRKTLLIDNPSALTVNGNGGATMDLVCGRQKGAKVRIDYAPPTEAGPKQAGIDGLARGITFEP
jgi:tetratricopeptide (TPR) repeat protein